LLLVDRKRAYPEANAASPVDEVVRNAFFIAEDLDPAEE
jgi:hypothetical protein